MKRISLPNGLFTLVDDRDFERLNAFKWYAYWDDERHGYYVSRYVQMPGRKLGLSLMHREILGLTTGDGSKVDHKNGDPLDNQRSNLRLATNQQNQANRGPQLNNTSGYKGVSKEPSSNRWRTYIKFNGKNKYLGTFDDKVEAARAYNLAATQRFGEFAWLNPVSQ